jgi:hypothetical protein
MILSPFYAHRFSWDLVFIVDLIFSGIVLFPLSISFFSKKKARWICRGSIIGLSIYILFCWIQHNRAIELTKRFAKDLKEEVVQVASLPQPLSPFRWANYVGTKEKVYQGFVDLKEGHSRFLRTLTVPLSFLKRFEIYRKVDNLFQSPEKLGYRSWQRLSGSPWVERALDTDGVRFFYWFARFPVVKSVNFRNGRHRVEFMDVRFFLPGIHMPFVYYVEFDDSGKTRSEGFVRD